MRLRAHLQQGAPLRQAQQACTDDVKLEADGVVEPRDARPARDLGALGGGTDRDVGAQRGRHGVKQALVRCTAEHICLVHRPGVLGSRGELLKLP